MAKDDFIRARIRSDLKHEGNDILHSLGLSTTDAITLFYKQVVAHNGLPFPVKIPNATTKKAMASRNKKTFSSVKALFKELNE